MLGHPRRRTNKAERRNEGKAAENAAFFVANQNGFGIMKTTVGELTQLLDGKVLRGELSGEITNFAALDQADGSCVSFYGNAKYIRQLKGTHAGLVLVAEENLPIPETAAVVLVKNPVLAFDSVIRIFGVKSPPFSAGVSPHAFVESTAQVDPDRVSIAPNATVSTGVIIGNGSRIGAGTFIGADAVIGEDCEIGPNVTVGQGCQIGDRVILHPGVVVGADGFGFEFVEGRHRKIEQLGIVRIDNDVEIGASSTIDRARFGETVIGEGTKIDNQVQIGHNCIIGKHCIIVAQTGISGSTRIGDYVVLAAQCGIAGHLTIADRVTCGGRSGVISSIVEPGGTYFGYPARPLKEDRRETMRVKQLGSLLKRVKDLEKKNGD